MELEVGMQYHLTLDKKRRTTWPVQLLEEAQLSGDDELVARPDHDHPGRIVVESREAIKRRVHQRAAEGRHGTDAKISAADDLVEERRTDRSLA